MKVPKRLTRDPITGAKVLERPFKLCIRRGKSERVYSTSAGYVLPEDARWATDADAHHDDVAAGVAHRAWNASKRR